MATVSTARSSHQHIGNIQLGRKTVKPNFNTPTVSAANSALSKAIAAKTHTEYLVHLSTAYKVIREELSK